jgi:hypothetical protein
MKILLLTTCIYTESNLIDLNRLISSIKSQSNPELEFVHYILFQNNMNPNLDGLLTSNANYNQNKLFIDGIVSLSKARNILIDNVFENENLDSFDYVSFPDDDCWYTDSFWRVFSEISLLNSIELFYTKFGSKPNKFSIGVNSHSTLSLINNASSNTTVYHVSILKKLKYFDESLGVGTKNNGGEDTDFAVRALLLSKSCYFHDDIIVGHRDALPEFRHKYYKGTFYVLRKYGLSNISIFPFFVRKLLVGLVFFICNKINVSDFRYEND